MKMIALFALSAALGGAALAEPSVPAAAIASGTPRWVDSNADPQDALINARVDLGTLKRIGDEIEAVMRWPIGPGLRRDLALRSPELQIPDGAVEVDRYRVRCGRDRLQSFAVETAIVAPDGQVLQRKRYDPDEARRREQEQTARLPRPSFQFARYGRSPHDLVCWAVARKCEGKPFTWPPPANDTRFDDPSYARNRDAHDALFVPSCKLR
jgi:hypothetical protein